MPLKGERATSTIEGTRIGHDDESCCVQEETLFGRLHCTVGIASAGESFASRRPSVCPSTTAFFCRFGDHCPIALPL